MIIYNVTLKVDTDIADAWVRWMKAEHMADLMNTGMFVDCRLCRLLGQDETDGITYSAQYFCANMEDYNNYINNYAEQLRDKGNRLFGGKFVAFRTVMEII
jgi:hypothetical protein